MRPCCMRSSAGGAERAGRYPAWTRLAVGNLVAYGSHGAGQVAARETKVVLGKRREVVVLTLTGGLSVDSR